MAKGCDGVAGAGGGVVSLRVLGGGKVRRSRMGWKRACVLVGVHVLMVAHVVQWWVSGMGGGERATLSPVEPSEAMYTLELGQVNAGFVIFVLALASTVVFGRFFCGWGCHIVALQDLCGWVMKKAGVHPKPWRTRLLLLMPLAMALYMFVWPTLRREVVEPGWAWMFGRESLEGMAKYLGVVAPRPALEGAFVVEDYWRTFPEWYVAVPFLLVCGFATVYFLGSKGFCTYGCPYGGFFAPLDKVSVGKIVVSDACEGCGHCTAVCTSNVRVHEEVAAYGKVVDPGCMKCLDCVSVCPKGALSFSLARPTLLTRARGAGGGRRGGRNYDTTLGEEAVLGVVFAVLTFVGYRGLWGQVPLLMSAGLAAIATWAVWKVWRLGREANVRAARWQLKRGGRVGGAGVAFAGATLALAGLGAWGTAVWWLTYSAGLVEWEVRVPAERVFSAGYEASAGDVERADRAISRFVRAGAWGEGGIGWGMGLESLSRVAWLHAVANRRAEAVEYLKRANGVRAAAADSAGTLGVRRQRSTDLCRHVLQQATVMAWAGVAEEEIAGEIRRWGEARGGMGELWLALARRELAMGRAEGARSLAGRAVESDDGAQGAGMTAVGASEVYLALGDGEGALAVVDAALAKQGRQAGVHAGRATVLAVAGRGEEALAALGRAMELAPGNAVYVERAAEVADALGKRERAEELRRKAGELRERGGRGGG